jgi:hypothetical protein
MPTLLLRSLGGTVELHTYTIFFINTEHINHIIDIDIILYYTTDPEHTYLGLPRSHNGFFKVHLDPGGGFTSETAARRFQNWHLTH